MEVRGRSHRLSLKCESSCTQSYTQLASEKQTFHLNWFYMWCTHPQVKYTGRRAHRCQSTCTNGNSHRKGERTPNKESNRITKGERLQGHTVQLTGAAMAWPARHRRKTIHSLIFKVCEDRENSPITPFIQPTFTLTYRAEPTSFSEGFPHFPPEEWNINKNIDMSRKVSQADTVSSSQRALLSFDKLHIPSLFLPFSDMKPFK